MNFSCVEQLYKHLMSVCPPVLSVRPSHFSRRYLVVFIQISWNFQKTCTVWKETRFGLIGRIYQISALWRPKMATIDGFQPLYGIVIIQSTPSVLYKLANWVFRNDLNWGYVRQISAFWRPENGSKTDGFWPLPRILITQPTSYLVYVLIMYVFRNE